MNFYSFNFHLSLFNAVNILSIGSLSRRSRGKFETANSNARWRLRKHLSQLSLDWTIILLFIEKRRPFYLPAWISGWMFTQPWSFRENSMYRTMNILYHNALRTNFYDIFRDEKNCMNHLSLSTEKIGLGNVQIEVILTFKSKKYGLYDHFLFSKSVSESHRLWVTAR